VENYLIAHGPALNSWALLGAIPLIAALESFSVRRALGAPLRARWLNNIGLFVLSMLAVNAVLPIRCTELAAIAEQRGWGLINKLAWDFWIELVVALVVLDLVRYIVHYAAHALPALWRIHRVHHTDPDFDVTTSLRFHPLELLIQVLVNFLVILSLGLPVAAVVFYEVISVVVNTANHGNIELPRWLDRSLRTVFVTPDMHRVHHSTDPGEYNANLGGLLSWWDYLFATYVAQPKHGHRGMSLGLPGFTSHRHLSLLAMLLNPIMRTPDAPRGAPRPAQATTSEPRIRANDR
jgi:sterol desaturase/sphingolipid hydroxylase (fatty acid hydroxylase superfamily)